MSRGHLTPVGSSERFPVLLVDDEPAVLRSLKRQISSWGYAVITAEKPSEALSACRTVRPCLIITDLLMPEMDGFQLALKLQEEHGENTPPMAVLTGDTQRPDLRNHPGVISILLKPTPPQYLRELIDRLCSDHRRPPYILPDDNSGPLDVA
jgi:CheY-like chemotaxis protein